MIKLASDMNDIFKLQDKVDEYKGTEVELNKFFNFLIMGMYQGTVFPFLSYIDDYMNGCLVAVKGIDMASNFLYVMFVWTDAHYPKVIDELSVVLDKKAEELGIGRILIVTDKNPSAVRRRIKHLGYTKEYVVFEKKVTNND